jgi:hypothetical protein
VNSDLIAQVAKKMQAGLMSLVNVSVLITLDLIITMIVLDVKKIAVYVGLIFQFVMNAMKSFMRIWVDAILATYPVRHAQILLFVILAKQIQVL